MEYTLNSVNGKREVTVEHPVFYPFRLMEVGEWVEFDCPTIGMNAASRSHVYSDMTFKQRTTWRGGYRMTITRVK